MAVTVVMVERVTPSPNRWAVMAAMALMPVVQFLEAPMEAAAAMAVPALATALMVVMVVMAVTPALTAPRVLLVP